MKRFAALFAAVLVMLSPAPGAAECFQSGLACNSFFGLIADVPQAQTMVTSGSVTVDPSHSLLFLHGTGIIGVYTVNLPPNPMDGQRAVITSDAVVTLLNVSGNGNPINGIVTGLAINGYARYAYSAAYGAWFRTG